jgi:2-amino-4-hydroxy-6-hydroxymethyldihydropteridine diphosphokinase/dihydropteroate synthase
MVGASRKGFIGRLTGRSEGDRIMGTAAAVAASIIFGAHFVRVHDVKEMVDVVRVADAVEQGSEAEGPGPADSTGSRQGRFMICP